MTSIEHEPGATASRPEGGESHEARMARIYIADPELRIAAEVALELGRPLLLTGDPGTGKTRFANYLAGRLAPAWFAAADDESPRPPFELFTFETKSTSVATDLFYRFDSMRRFQAVHDDKMSRDDLDYISFEALGKAILHSLPASAVEDLVPDARAHPGPRRSVVLIDEVDKASRDFPNDLLNEIDQMFFRIPELPARDGRGRRRVDADPRYRPIVVLTSNSEKNLPQAFLRRCVFHHIRFPDRAHASRLSDIVSANLGQASGTLAADAIEFFYKVREQLNLDKPPTTHELVEWIRLLQSRRWSNTPANVQNTLLSTLPVEELKATLGVVAKTANDLAKVQELLAPRDGPAR